MMVIMKHQNNMNCFKSRTFSDLTFNMKANRLWMKKKKEKNIYFKKFPSANDLETVFQFFCVHSMASNMKTESEFCFLYFGSFSNGKKGGEKLREYKMTTKMEK